MKRLLLDYLRRKAWILALCSLPLTALGAAAATPKEANSHLIGVIFQFAFIMAALPLSLDLQQGMLRVTSLLPIGARQLGRTWWWAGVGVPSALISVLLLIGGIIPTVLFPSVSARWDALLLCAVSIWLWLGSAFTVLFSLRKDASQGWSARVKTVGGGLVWALMAGGGFLLTRWIESYVGVQIAFLLVGAILTVLGWARAEAFVLARAATPASASSARASLPRSGLKLETGCGGLAYLLTRTCLPATLIGVGILLFTPLILVISNGKSWDAAIKGSAGSNSTPYWFMFIFALMPALMHLKFLRTLPLSASRLALALLSMFLVPCIILGGISCLCLALASGREAAVALGQRHLVAILPMSLVLPIALWRGLGRGTYALLILWIIVVQTLPAVFSTIFARQSGPGPLLVAGAFLTLPLAVFLTRLALERGGKAYRPGTTPFSPIWSGAR